MKDLRRISVLVLSVLCAVFSYADKDPVVHDFNELNGAGKISYANSNKKGTIGSFTYTCTGSTAEFYLDLIRNTRIAINLKGSNDMVTTTAVDSLAGIIMYYDDDRSVPTVELRLSRDSVHWTDPIPYDPSNFIDGLVEYNFVPGRYFVRITNTASNKTSILKFTYSFGWCNCFLYIPE